MRKSIEEVRAFFANDKFATENGCYIEEVGDGYSVCSLEITEHHLNARGGLMGGVHPMLADFAFAVAVNAETASVVSANCNISYIGMPKSKKIYANAKAIKEGRTLVFYEVMITDELGNKIAKADFTGCRVG